MKKITKFIIMSFLCILSFIILTSCSKTKYYTIIYNTYDSSSLPESTVKIEVGKEVNLVIPIQLDNLDFKGWYLDEEYSDGPYTKYQCDDEKEITFYAKWVVHVVTEKEQINMIINLINLLPENITINDQEQIAIVWKYYDELPLDAQAKVTNRQALLTKKAELDNLIEESKKNEQITRIINTINGLPTVIDLTHENLINKTFEDYNELDQASKLLVTNITILNNKITDLNNLKEQINQIVDKITNLTSITNLDDATTIIEIQNLYNDLSIINQPYVTNYQLFQEKIASYLSSKQKVDEINQKIALLLKIDNISINEKESVNDIINLYQQLDTVEIKYISNYQQIVTIKVTIDNLQNDIEIIISRITNLPENVALSDENIVIEIRNAYDSLPLASKTKITNYQVLLDKEQQLVRLKEEKQKVDLVIEAITNLPTEITLEDEELLKSIRNKYDNLTESQQLLVSNYQTLVEKENNLTNLKSNQARLVDKAITKLPGIITYDDYDEVHQVLDLYNSLEQSLQENVTHYNLLQQALIKLENIENDKNTITYVLGKDIYTSRTLLFEAFFTDFYYYILYNYGLNAFKNTNVNNVSQFLALAKDYNAGRGTMRALGDTFGSYLLQKDINGVLEDQSSSGFFGYCYKNNKYQDLLPFFIRFFAYWRLDEGYANQNNYGADIFAESWAPTVDICKFFYYNESTSYVKSSRMLDCFNNTSNVVYGDLPTTFNNNTLVLPTNITLRGYTFDGWYLNADYTSEKVTSITNNNEKVILYAKWIENSSVKDQDDASLVDVYIYNLTTTKANLTKLNVQKVRKMYDELSNNAKSLVVNYQTLVNYESTFREDLTTPKVVTINLNKPIINNDLSSMSQAFLNDYNSITNQQIDNFNVFNSDRYSQMSKLKAFFNNNLMFTKWAFLASYFANINQAAKGLVIQSNRILNQENGDLEYVCKAIGALFTQANALSDTEINIDFSTPSVIDQLINKQNQIIITFTKEGNLPTLVYNDYNFIGYFDDLNSNNAISQITDELPLVLYCKWQMK